MSIIYPKFNPVGFSGSFTGSYFGENLEVQNITASNITSSNIYATHFLISADVIETKDLVVLEDADFSGSAHFSGGISASAAQINYLTGIIAQFTHFTASNFSASNLFVGNNFLLSANTVEANDLQVLENTILSGTVDITGALGVTGSLILTGTVDVSGDVRLLNNITASAVSASAYYGGSLSTTNFTSTNFNTTNLTASYAYISNDIFINGTASIVQLNTLNQNQLVVGDKYITILSGAADHISLDKSGIYWGSGSSGSTYGDRGEHAHVTYDSAGDYVEIYPGLSASFVSGTFIGNGLNISSITASNIIDFADDVRRQLSAGTNISITSGQISYTGNNISAAEITASFPIRQEVSGAISSSVAFNSVFSTPSQITASYPTRLEVSGAISSSIAFDAIYSTPAQITASYPVRAEVSASISGSNIFARLSSANTFSANQTITGTLYISGPITSSTGLSSSFIRFPDGTQISSSSGLGGGGLSSVLTSGSITGSGLTGNEVTLKDIVTINTLTASYFSASNFYINTLSASTISASSIVVDDPLITFNTIDTDVFNVNSETTLSGTFSVSGTTNIVGPVTASTGVSASFIRFPDGTQLSSSTGLGGGGISGAEVSASFPVRLEVSGAISGSNVFAKLAVANTFTANQTITGNLYVSSSITSSQDIYVNGIRIGRGPKNNSTNTLVGNNSMTLSTGFVQNNTSVGYGALQSATDPFNNTAIGYGSLGYLTNGQNNIGIGLVAGQGITSGISNIIIGSTGGTDNGSNNIVIGNNAQGYLNNNISIGTEALFSNTQSEKNVAIGNYAGRNYTNGTGSVFLGGYSGSALSNTNNNVLISDGTGNIRLHINSAGNSIFSGTLSATQITGSSVSTSYITSSQELTASAKYISIGNASPNVTNLIDIYSNRLTLTAGTGSFTTAKGYIGFPRIYEPTINGSLIIESTNIALSGSVNIKGVLNVDDRYIRLGSSGSAVIEDKEDTYGSEDFVEFAPGYNTASIASSDIIIASGGDGYGLWIGAEYNSSASFNNISTPIVSKAGYNTFNVSEAIHDIDSKFGQIINNIQIPLAYNQSTANTINTIAGGGYLNSDYYLNKTISFEILGYVTNNATDTLTVELYDLTNTTTISTLSISSSATSVTSSVITLGSGNCIYEVYYKNSTSNGNVNLLAANIKID